MLNQFVRQLHNYHKPITFLGLALLVASCAAGELPGETTTDTSSSTSQETPVATEASDHNATTQEAASHSTQSSDTDIETLLKSFEQGTQYAVVRDRLIQAGWMPVKAPEPGEFGVERQAYDAGFTEVTACAGTGAGQCQFNFENSAQKKSLSITTYGGSELQFGDWTISPYSPTKAASPNDGTIAVSNPIIQEGRSEIPSQFQGEWNMNLNDCGSLLSDGRLVISANQLQFYESSAQASSIQVTGTAGLTVTAEYSSEGETFTETDSFKLSSDSSTLTHIQTGAIRYRCSR